MKVISIEAGSFLCDGGGIFGGVPKVLWSRHIKADERNLIRLAMRCMLVVEGDRKVLIETGAGTKLTWKFIENNGIDNPNQLLDSLALAGYTPDDITDVLHTHLHWDHCGGGTLLNESKAIVPTFPNARYICARTQWDNAMNPNPREGDAYFPDDLLPIKEAGLLHLIDDEQELFPGFEMRIFNGHTPGMIVPVIDNGKRKIAYVSDLTPLTANVPLKWIAAYDLFPVTAMEEKKRFSREAVDTNMVFFFEHDPIYECCTLKWDERKGPLVDRKGNLSEI